jgi:hypothetical protein
MIYVLFFMVTYSIAFIITQQKVFEEVRCFLGECSEQKESFITRKLCQLVNCPSCVGFWAGVVITYLGLNIFNINQFDPFFGGLTASLSCYFIHLFKETIEAVINKHFGIEL